MLKEAFFGVPPTCCSRARLFYAGKGGLPGNESEPPRRPSRSPCSSKVEQASVKRWVGGSSPPEVHFAEWSSRISGRRAILERWFSVFGDEGSTPLPSKVPNARQQPSRISHRRTQPDRTTQNTTKERTNVRFSPECDKGYESTFLTDGGCGVAGFCTSGCEPESTGSTPSDIPFNRPRPHPRRGRFTFPISSVPTPSLYSAFSEEPRNKALFLQGGTDMVEKRMLPRMHPGPPECRRSTA